MENSNKDTTGMRHYNDKLHLSKLKILNNRRHHAATSMEINEIHSDSNDDVMSGESDDSEYEMFGNMPKKPNQIKR